MKNLLLVSLFFILSATTYAQTKLSFGKTKADYQRVFGKFIKYYNSGQVDSIQNLFSDRWGDSKEKSWNENNIKHTKDELGEIISYKYIGPFEKRIDVDSNLMPYFKLVFSKPAVSDVKSINGKRVHAACISLDKNNKILGIAFITSSPEIDSMISKY